jgi:hypothetical protein
MYCYSRLATYKEFVVTTTGTFKTWFFNKSRIIPGYTSLTHGGKDLSLCTRLQALDLIAYSTRMATRYQILGILNIYIGFILDQLGTSSIGASKLILPVQLHFIGLRLVLCASLLKGPHSRTSST